MDPQHITVPAGYETVEADGESLVRRRAGSIRDRSISCRLTAAEYADLISFFETFPRASVSDGMRWLLHQPAVTATIQSRLAAVTS